VTGAQCFELCARVQAHGRTYMSVTVICVPRTPAHGTGVAFAPGLKGTSFPSLYLAFHAFGLPAVMDMMVTCATWVILASASPRKPYV